MNRTSRDNILGCLLGDVVGDAMGVATKVCAMGQIKGQLGGYAREFFTSPEDTFAHGCKWEQITDDFSIAYMSCVETVNNHGITDGETARKALSEWYEAPEFKRFAGLIIEATIQTLAEGTPVDTEQETLVLAIDSGKGTSGAAIEAAPIALSSGDDVELTIRNTVKLYGATRNSNITLSGAYAIAAATAQAPHEGTTLNEIIDAGVYGAVQEDQPGRASEKTICGPSIEKRIKKAVELGTLTKGMEEALTLIEDYTGNGLMAAEAVPAVLGLIATSKGGLLEVFFAGVNIGDDVGMVATIISGIMGAYRGASSSPDEYLTVVKENNRIDIEGLVEQVEELRKGEQEHV